MKREYPGDLEGLDLQAGEPQNCHILITGPSGSGKTYLSDILRCQGLEAYDADTIDGLTGWFDSTGNRVKAPTEPDRFFLNHHAFLWNREVLIHFLSLHRTVYLFGISRNALEMTDVFHKVYFLKVPPPMLAERLKATDRANPMGRTAFQVEYSLSWARTNEEKAKNLGIQMINGTLPAEQILLQIVDGIPA